MLKNNIKLLRKEKNITIRDLESKIHINRATLSRMENGKQNISDEYLNSLATFFNVSTDYLLGISDIRNPKDDIKIKSDPIYFSLYEEVKELTDEQKKEIVKKINNMRK